MVALLCKTDPNDFFCQSTHLAVPPPRQNTQVQDENTNLPADFFPPHPSGHTCAEAHVDAEQNRTAGKGLARSVLIVLHQARA